MQKGLIRIVLIIVATFVFAAPQAHAALTEAQITSVLNLLSSFNVEQSVIVNVEASLRGTVVPSTGQSTPTVGQCLTLTNTLRIGSTDKTSNDEVSALQQFLTDTGDYTFGSITGYLGTITEAAVRKWQAKNSIVSSGTAATTGYGVVGPKTRAAIETACEVTDTTTDEVIVDQPEPEVDEPAETTEETTTTSTEPEVVTPTDPATCTISSTQKFPIVNVPFTLSWTSENSTHVTFDPDTTNTKDAISGVFEDDLPLPTGNLLPNDSEPISTNSDAEHVAVLNVFGEKGNSSCSVKIQVLKNNSTGYYEGVIDGTTFVATSQVTKEAALGNCDLKVSQNPDANIVCKWRDDQIYP